MLHPETHARTSPDHPAVVMCDSGEVVSYAQLDKRSRRFAALLHAEGLRPGDGVALFLENHPRYFEVCWGALRSGLYLTTVNRYLAADEAGYIVNDCGAKVLVTSASLAEVAGEVANQAPGCTRRLMIGGTIDGFESYESAIEGHEAAPFPAGPFGETMLYSSGTTGHPKGIRRPIADQPSSDGYALGGAIGKLFNVDEGSVYLSPAPLYHSAPLAFTLGVQALGGTVAVMERFDARAALRAIEEHGVTHSQWVPTMFSRMLKLPAEDRTGFDLSSHKVAVHAAAPCPKAVKHEMIDWWGPIIHEYWGGTETGIATYIGSEDWLARPGSVGRALANPLHVCDEDGRELGPNEAGLIYVELTNTSFEYHNAPEKTKNTRHPEHPSWVEIGDVGYLDEEGFLFLTDRATFMIISGGVNIYPQEIENELIVHPKVADVAVIGVPNEDFGEEVKAIVQPAEGVAPDDALTTELLAYAGERLAKYKCPRSINYEAELPRLPTGKLYKRLLKDRYWGDSGSSLVADGPTRSGDE